MGRVFPILAMVLVLLMEGRAAHAASTSPVSLDVRGREGSLRIVNKSHAAVEIARAIAIQSWSNGSWGAAVPGFKAISTCSPPMERATGTAAGADDAPVWLKAHAALRVVPFNGFSCYLQCTPTICLSNYPYGPGRFRFVVTILPSGQQIASPAFHMSGKPL